MRDYENDTRGTIRKEIFKATLQAVMEDFANNICKEERMQAGWGLGNIQFHKRCH